MTVWARLAAALCLMAALAACGPLPRPFARYDGEPIKPLAQNIPRDSIAIDLPRGASRPMGQMLAGAIAERLERTYELPAAASGLDNSHYLLSGTVRLPAPPPPGAADAGIVIDWQLADRNGAIIADFSDPVAGSLTDWDYGSPALVAGVGEAVSERVARLVLGDRFDAGSDQLLGKNGIFVDAVSGAPGDGNAALRRAMSVALGGGGYKLAETPDTAAFVLGGDVSVGPADPGAMQPVRIVWTVRGADGAVLGTAAQSNAVPAGSLDGRWGQTAAFVAAAALDGIGGIVRDNDPSDLRAPDLGGGPSRRAPAALPSRDLPQVPGRAPPPPG